MTEALYRCPNINIMAWTKDVVETKHGTGHLLVYPRCKQWSCEFCARKNSSVWRAHLLEKLPQLSQNWHFVTLTARPEDEGFERSYKAMQRGIDVLLKRVRRVWGAVDYVRVFEAHTTRDALHAHLLISNLTEFVALGASAKHVPMVIPVDRRYVGVRCWSLKSWVKANSWESGMGYIADCQPVVNEYAVHYVCKYMTKDLQRFEIKGLRHVSTSRNVGGIAGDKSYDWGVGSFVTTHDFPDQKRIIVTATGEVLDPRQWEDNQRWHDDALWDIEHLD